jgi:tetratricopeptide (TPR) repeat protein
LIHRSERNYNEAIKAYKQALRIDSGNLQILRDLSLLQIQLRDLHGFALTRQTILNLKPNQMIHWLTFALAKHLLGDLQGAVEVIDIYKRTLDRDAPELNRGFEASELALYQNDLIAKIPNNYQAALHHLELHRHLIIDEISYWTMRGSYLLYLARFEEAQDAFMKLLSMGMTEDYATHAGLMCAIVRIIDPHICATALSLRDGMGTLSTMIPLSHEQQQLLLRFYLDTLAGLYPKSNTISRIPLTLFQGEHLEKALDEYCRKNISKGVPSLGYDLSSLFLDQRADRLILLTDPADVRVHPTYLMIVRFIQTYMDELESGSSFSSHPTDQSKSTDGVREPPSTLLWTWYLRAVLHELAGEYTQAISFAERCLQHTATAVDMYELKGRLLKAAGDIDAAANVLDTGRALDKQDRYINNLTTLYLLQANREDEALERISLFTRHESPTEKNIFDMQTIWYELEAAACYRRQEKFGKGLKKYSKYDDICDYFCLNGFSP